MSRTINFNAGPAALPLPALTRARDEMLDFAGSGMSVMEHSHRGKEYEGVHDEAIALVRQLLGVPSDYEVLLLQGGATALFAEIAMNLLEKGKSAQYLITGSWGEKALGEAKIVSALFGATVSVQSTGVGEGKGKSYTRVPPPAEVTVDPGAAYLHITSNETIHGAQFNVDASRPFPDTGAVPLIADMSSDFLWRPFDVTKFGLVYAGAQKNLGPSGVVVAVVSKEVLDRGRKDIPKIFQFRTHAENKSLYNTPPTFGIYMVRNVLAWLKGQGGLAKVEEMVAGGEGEPVGDERGLPASQRGTRGAVHRRCQEERHGRPEGAPFRRWNPRIHLQRGVLRMGGHACRLHGGIRPGEVRAGDEGRFGSGGLPPVSARAQVAKRAGEGPRASTVYMYGEV
jgi:phosphoserine aminotransferase